jgi:hypothetical protein
MSENHSNPKVIEIFKVNLDQASVDTKKHKWDSFDLLKNAMLTFEPDNYQPEILIKQSEDSPLIRSVIEELDIEEWKNTATLFGEIWNLDQKIWATMGEQSLSNHTISIDTSTGKLLGVAITGKKLPQSLASDLLINKLRLNPGDHPAIFYQMPIQIASLAPSANVMFNARRGQIDQKQSYTTLESVTNKSQNERIDTKEIHNPNAGITLRKSGNSCVKTVFSSFNIAGKGESTST